jgi:hypothetical protein
VTWSIASVLLTLKVQRLISFFSSAHFFFKYFLVADVSGSGAKSQE